MVITLSGSITSEATRPRRTASLTAIMALKRLRKGRLRTGREMRCNWWREPTFRTSVPRVAAARDEIVARQVGVQDLDILAHQPPPQTGHTQRLVPVHQGQGQDVHRTGGQLPAQAAFRPHHTGHGMAPPAHARGQIQQTDFASVKPGHRTQVGNAHRAGLPGLAIDILTGRTIVNNFYRNCKMVPYRPNHTNHVLMSEAGGFPDGASPAFNPPSGLAPSGGGGPGLFPSPRRCRPGPRLGQVTTDAHLDDHGDGWRPRQPRGAACPCGPSSPSWASCFPSPWGRWSRPISGTPISPRSRPSGPWPSPFRS